MWFFAYFLIVNYLTKYFYISIEILCILKSHTNEIFVGKRIFSFLLGKIKPNIPQYFSDLKYFLFVSPVYATELLFIAKLLSEHEKPTDFSIPLYGKIGNHSQKKTNAHGCLLTFERRTTGGVTIPVKLTVLSACVPYRNRCSVVAQTKSNRERHTY